MAQLSEKMEGCRDPFAEPHPFYVLIETSGSNAQHDMEKLMTLLESGGLVLAFCNKKLMADSSPVRWVGACLFFFGWWATCRES